ncbi:hypothetical protein [Streptomyces niveus]|uniref:hypothetical protein n=1 Tax=Streptomyces niveus TaxID=193462 RepID=UPI0036D3A190
MPRIQILELPEGAGDDRPPFLVIIDQAPTDEAKFDAIRRDLLADGDPAERLGARAVLVFEDTIDIPANDTTAYLEAAASGSLPSDIQYEFNLKGLPEQDAPE